MNTNGTIVYNKEYNDAEPKWELVRDCVKGDKAIKDKGTQYLPKPCAHDNSQENTIRYSQYKTRAYFMNVVKRTKTALVGSAFFNKPSVDLEPQLEYMLDDCDGNGLGIIQKAKQVVGEVTETGRFGILVDFPRVEGESSKMDIENGARPFFACYKTEAIADWRVKRFGAISKLSAVKLLEQSEMVDEYGFSTGEFYDIERVLYLDDEGFYAQKVTGNDQEAIYEPLDANGNRFRQIPFQFIGSENNDYTVDESLLYDLAVLNVAHYRNSADYEESVFKVGQAMLAIYTDNGEDDLSGDFAFGSSNALLLAQGDKAEILQAKPNLLVENAKNMKLQEMKAIGAKLITPTKQQTAEAARIEHGAEVASISTVSENVSDALTKCLAFADMMLSTNPSFDNAFIMSNEFFFTAMDATMRKTWIEDVMAGNVTKEDYWAALRESRLLPETRKDEDIADDLINEAPSIVFDGE